MAQRDMEAFASHVSPEAIFFGDTAVLRGKRAVLAEWRPFFEKPTAPFSWKPDMIEVLPSGALAISSGPVFDPGGKKIGNFSSIWRGLGSSSAARGPGSVGCVSPDPVSA